MWEGVRKGGQKDESVYRQKYSIERLTERY
jgi:hypothetical protein